MAVRNVYKQHFFFMFHKTENNLAVKRYQRDVNNSKKLRPSLDDFKFTRDWSLNEDEETE